MPAAPLSLVVLALLVPQTARAGGQSIDVELLRPGFSPGLALGVDDPAMAEKGAVRVGTVVQYVRDPLVLYQWGDYVGSVVDHRIAAHLGFSWDPSDDLSVRVVLPTAAQWGTEVPDYAAQVVGVGDLSAGVRYSRWTWNAVEIGLRGDLSLPVGSQEAYMGERYPRLHLGVLGGLDLGPVRVVGDAGFTFRAPVDTGEDLYLGQELVLNAGASAPLVQDRLAVSASLVTRLGLTPSWHGSAELPMEAVGAVHLWPTRAVRVDAGVGKGVGYGYGTSNFRVLAGVTVSRVAAEPELIVEIEEPEEIPEDLPEAEIVPEPELKVWREGERARLEDDRIELRDPIQFELGTARILEESLPILHAVAEILEENWTIGELLVEGHASEEGSFTYNHDLSILRAASIYKELMLAGVHPERMAYRGMGEVQPAEGDLAASRRVEFQVLRWAEPGEETPPVVSQVPKPWDGELTVVSWPRPPAAPARAERGDGDDVVMVPWEAFEGMEIACDTEVGEQVTAAETRLMNLAEDGVVDVDEAATALARAEAAMGCGPVVGADLLARFWLAAGATAVASGDLEMAEATLTAASRVAPDSPPEGYDPWTRKVYMDARKQRTVYGWLTVSSPPGWWTSVDGAEVIETRAVPAGLHLVQTGAGDRAGFARVVSVLPARETVITVVKETSSADVLLGSTVHDPWAPVALTPAPMPRAGIPDSVAWPEAAPDDPPILAALRREDQPTPWEPPGLADPSVVFTRPKGLDAWYKRMDSWDISLGSASVGAGAMALGLVAAWAQYRFSQADTWGSARTWSGVNHVAIVGGTTLGLASAGLLSWAVVEGEW